MSGNELSDFGGSLHVLLDVADGCVQDVTVHSSRPQHAAHVLLGRSPEDAIMMLSRLFSLCGRAQTIAGLKAIEQAQGIILSVPNRAARTVLRIAEMLSQTALRLCLDWARLLGLAPNPTLAKACLAAEASFEHDLYGAANWKVPGGLSFSPNVDAIRNKSNELARLIDTLFVYDGFADQMRHALGRLKLEGFGALGTAMKPEDGAFSRQWATSHVDTARQNHGAGLLARLESRLTELTTLPKDILTAVEGLMSSDSQTQQSCLIGTGTACVDTARGKLTHTVSLKDGIISAYEVEAPTDENFAQNGPVAAGLMRVDAKDTNALKHAAELHVLAIDPCVKCVVEVRHA